jgi:hypothetical protein
MNVVSPDDRTDAMRTMISSVPRLAVTDIKFNANARPIPFDGFRALTRYRITMTASATASPPNARRQTAPARLARNISTDRSPFLYKPRARIARHASRTKRVANTGRSGLACLILDREEFTSGMSTTAAVDEPEHERRPGLGRPRNRGSGRTSASLAPVWSLCRRRRPSQRRHRGFEHIDKPQSYQHRRFIS